MNDKMMHGKFVISLDFELMWGVRDQKSKQDYGANILGVHKVIPVLLETFKKYDIKATFSTVGFLFFETKLILQKEKTAESFLWYHPTIWKYLYFRIFKGIK